MHPHQEWPRLRLHGGLCLVLSAGRNPHKTHGICVARRRDCLLKGAFLVHMDKDVVGGILVVRLRGDLDHHAVEPLRDEIEQSLEQIHYRGLVLSFQDIDFMDSSGLGLILGRYRTLSSRGGKMALCEVNKNLEKIFELSGIFKIVQVFHSEDTALRAIKEA